MEYNFNDITVQHIQQEYSRSDLPWVIGFSGGKDSSALLSLVFNSLLGLTQRSKPVKILYCDTGVDIPVVRSLATQTLKGITAEANKLNLPLSSEIVYPNIEDSYFAKVIGRGYPPPTNKFRWCTDRLRINPVKKALALISDQRVVILLGIRRGESLERDKTISKHESRKCYYFRQSDNKNAIIYSPIVNYTVEEIWATIAFNSIPKSIDAIRLMALYRKVSGECPIIRDPKSPPCGKGRFGCWTCTVVRKDRAVEALVQDGHEELAPLLEFRNWLVEIRSDPQYRCKQRRNGDHGPGPFKLEARHEILNKLLDVEWQSGLSLIIDEELELIKNLWELDKSSREYVEG